MDYEKKYEEALKKAKEIITYYKGCNRDEASIEDLETIFPELKESGDEKVIKWLTNLLSTMQYHHCDEDMEMGNKALAWLEKQRTSEEALQYLKENHSPSEMSDFQVAMNIAVAKAYDKGMKDGLEKQGEQNPYSGVSFSYNGHTWGMCARDNGIEIAMDGIPVRQFSCKDCEQTFGGKSTLEGINEVKVDNSNSLNIADEYSGLTDFEGTLADVCIGWIGKELGWKQYIKDNADVLLKIAIKKFNSVQDASFEQKSAKWSEEDEKMIDSSVTNLAELMHRYGEKYGNVGKCIDWLKSLKQRIGG